MHTDASVTSLLTRSGLFCAGAPKADAGKDAVEADYSRIDRDLIAPIRLVRRRLRKVTYQGD